MSYTVRSDENISITLCATDLVKSVLQNIAVLLATKKGTVPLYREFGLSMDYIDKPIDVAQSLMAVEIEEAIAEFEPRAEVKNISFEEDSAISGKLAAIVEVEIIDEQQE